ncbi:MAG: glycine cleavage system protein GcvH [bacterium]
MNLPEELYYTSEHEWVRLDGDKATIGITDYAQSELGDIVFVELPAVGEMTTQGEPFGTIEAVKAVSDLFAPLTGEVVAINTKLEESPELVNSEPYGEGWLIKLKVVDAKAEGLLSAEEYGTQIN